MVSNAEMIAQLHDNLSGLPAKDVGFAKSLTQQFYSKGKLSDKQWHWVGILTERAQGIPDFTVVTKDAVLVGSMSGIVGLFAKAASKLKYPAITLGVPHTDATVRLTLASPDSKNPGHVYVKTGNGVYVGKVSPDGEFFPTASASHHPITAIASVLQSLARNPAKVAAEHGHLTGKCCFCNSELTDEKSTSVGYGPTCAKHYGLAWGKKAA